MLFESQTGCICIYIYVVCFLIFFEWDLYHLGYWFKSSLSVCFVSKYMIYPIHYFCSMWLNWVCTVCVFRFIYKSSIWITSIFVFLCIDLSVFFSSCWYYFLLPLSWTLFAFVFVLNVIRFSIDFIVISFWLRLGLLSLVFRCKVFLYSVSELIVGTICFVDCMSVYELCSFF